METSIATTKTYIVAEIDLVYRTHIKPSRLPIVTSAADAYDIFLGAWNLDQIELLEQFKVLLLNRRNRVLGIVDHSSGGIAGAVCDLRHYIHTDAEI
ncbi:MAG: JAB domain-containing protein [Chitinophagaceae bacterium]